MNFIDECRTLIGLESTPSHGNRAVAEYLAELAQSMGQHVTFQNETLNGLEQSNLIIRPQETRPGEELLLQTHLDTVDPGNYAMWTQTQANPFNASIYEGDIFGLGAADTKLDFLCKLVAAKEFVGRSLRLPFVLVGTFGAQNGMAGAVKLVRRKMVSAKKALIGEPTGLRIVNEGQGLAVVEISIPFSQEEINYRKQHDLMESSSTQSRMFSGKAAHSSDPKLGENAIVKMLEYLVQLPEGLAIMELDGGISFNSVPSTAVLEIDMVAGFKDPIVPKISNILKAAREVEKEFILHGKEYNGKQGATPTMNIGEIRTYDDQVRVTGSCRMPHSVSERAYEGWMRRLGEACESQGATFHVKDYKKSFKVSDSSEFLKSCSEILEEMKMDQAPSKISVSTEASVFTRLGIECLVFGPGESVGNSHAPNERVKVKDLEKAVEFYKRAIERFCV